MKAGEFC